jgi:cytochrome c nitrite reductase small subunit
VGKLAIVLAGLTGTLAGLGVYTFHYGEGLSYFSTDPRACKNCHVMNDQAVDYARLAQLAAATRAR